MAGCKVSVRPMKREIYEELFGDRFRAEEEIGAMCYSPAPPKHAMGLAPGGRMRPTMEIGRRFSGSETLAGLKSVARTGRETGESQFAEV